MVRYILGTVALAATGYGLKRHIEDEIEAYNICKNARKKDKQEDEEEMIHVNLYDDEFEIIPELKEIIEKYEDTKRVLRQNSLRELKKAIAEIRDIEFTTEQIISNFDYIERYDFKESSDELIKEFEHYTNILQDTKNYIDKHLDKVDMIIIASDDYKTYGDEDKNLIDTFVSICTILDKIDNTKITNNKTTIVREVKRGYGKLEGIIY